MKRKKREALSLFKTYTIGFVAVKVMCWSETENTFFETGQDELVMQ